MATTSDDKNHPLCIFYGGTLSGQKHRRMMFGFVVEFILEPVYLRDKKDDANRKDITHRQLYRRSPRDDKDGALGYILHTVEKA